MQQEKKRKGGGEDQFVRERTFGFDLICLRRNKDTEIRNDQITGGMLGFYNPSITQRLNNLKEQSEVSSTNNIQLLNIDPLADTETDV